MDSHTREPRQSNLANIGQVIDPKRSLSGSSVKPGKSSSKNKISTLSSSPESSYMNEDNVNSYLQNEEFLRELQQDEEFMNALQKGNFVKWIWNLKNREFCWKIPPDESSIQTFFPEINKFHLNILLPIN
jgi:hypothetical protein